MFHGAQMQFEKFGWASVHQIHSQAILLDIHLEKTMVFSCKDAHSPMKTTLIFCDGTPMTMDAPVAPIPSKETLPPMYRRILNMLSREIPRDGPWIVAKLQQEFSKKAAYDSSFRSIMAELMRHGYVVNVPGQGYLLL